MVNALTVSKTTVRYATISHATIKGLTNFRCAMQHTRQYPLCSATYQAVSVVQLNIPGSICVAVQHILGPGPGVRGVASYMYNAPKHFLIIFQVMQKALGSSCTSKACF